MSDHTTSQRLVYAIHAAFLVVLAAAFVLNVEAFAIVALVWMVCVAGPTGMEGE